jgi:hypothetical protein
MKHFKRLAILAFCLSGLAALSSFTVRENHSTYPSKVRDNPVPTTITLTYTGFDAYPTLYCSFTSEGGLQASGTATMVVNTFGNVFHCHTTFVTEQGTFTIQEECNQTTWVGQWQIVEGTGAYENLHGNGKLSMPDWGTIYTGKISWLNKE